MKILGISLLLLSIFSGIHYVILHHIIKNVDRSNDAVMSLSNTFETNYRELRRIRKDIEKISSRAQACKTLGGNSLPVSADSSSETATKNTSVSTQQASDKVGDNDKVTSRPIDEATFRESRIFALEDKLLTQQEDLAWELSATEDIKLFFNILGNDALQLEDIYCSGAMCRIEISHKDTTTLNGEMIGERAIVPWSHKGERFTLDETSASPRSVYYLTRK